MPADLKLFLTHIFSRGLTTKTTGGAGTIAANGTTLTDATKNFVALGVAAGDVVRLTSPATVDGQAAVVKTVAATVLSFYVPFASGGLSAAYRVEAPRQVSDVSDDVLRLEQRDYLSDLVGSVSFELSNSGQQYEGVFAPRDPVELWIDDGDAATPPPSMPTSVSDTDDDTENSRCFIGRIDRIERDKTEQGEILRVFARDYAADLLDTPVDAVFINCPMLRVSALGEILLPNVVESLQKMFNGSDAAALVDQEDDFKAGVCGVMRDRATGRPTLALDTSSAVAGTTTNPQGDVAFATESFFDAFARVAGICTQLTAGTFVGEPLRFFVDGYTYHPRRQDRTGVGQDDPRPAAGANPGAGNPTVVIKTPAEVQGAALPFSITEGTNAVAVSPLMDSERTRNTVTLLGTKNDDAPVVVRSKQSASFRDAHGQLVLGRDRYGALGNVAQARGLFDVEAAEAAASAALIRTRAAKERRTITRVMSVVPGRRLSGALVTVVAPTAGLNQSVGIAGARHQWDARGLTTEFDLTFIRPGWDRLLSPIEKSVREVIREDVWRAWAVYIMDVDTSFVLTFKRVAAHEYGDATKETTLFTVANPPQGTYPTSAADPWVPMGFRFYDGLIFILWIDPGTAQGSADNNHILFQIVNAYDGSSAVGGDGIYKFMDDGVTEITATSGAALPVDIWVEAHVNAQTDPVQVAQFAVWIGGVGTVRRYFLRRDFRRVLLRNSVVTLPTFASQSLRFGRFFLMQRDDGHIVWHGIARDAADDPRWSVYDISEDAGGFEFQEDLEAAKIGHSITSDRDSLGVYVLGADAPPYTPMFLKFTKRWGELGWERTLGTGAARTLSVRTIPFSGGGQSHVVGRVDLVPYTRLFFFP